MPHQGALPAGTRLGAYELVGLLGSGGMAEVYRARDGALGREVAIKVLTTALAHDASSIERFREEARLVAALNHPHIVPVYASGEEHGRLYFVMPVLAGSLRELLACEGRLPFAEAAWLVIQTATALQAAHALEIVHGDVKPENILLDAEGTALLSDFGVAREGTLSGGRTLGTDELPLGTPEYMAPEQLRGQPVDHRADIYSLGVVLYEMLTGSVPHTAPTPRAVRTRVLGAPVVPPSAHTSSIWPDLEDVMLTALAREPGERFGQMRDFAQALRRAVMQHQRTVAPPLGAISAEADAPATASVPHGHEAAPARGGTTGAPRVAQVPARGMRRPLPRRLARRRPVLAMVLVAALVGATLVGAALLLGGAFAEPFAPQRGQSSGALALPRLGNTPPATPSVTVAMTPPATRVPVPAVTAPRPAAPPARPAPPAPTAPPMPTAVPTAPTATPTATATATPSPTPTPAPSPTP